MINMASSLPYVVVTTNPPFYLYFNLSIDINNKNNYIFVFRFYITNLFISPEHRTQGPLEEAYFP
jgi:hypothetical protein